jgi:hypothetical protein
MFTSKAGAYPREEPLRYSPLRYAPGLTNKNNTRMERPAKDKHSSLLKTFVKSFITRAPGQKLALGVWHNLIKKIYAFEK